MESDGVIYGDIIDGIRTYKEKVLDADGKSVEKYGYMHRDNDIIIPAILDSASDSLDRKIKFVYAGKHIELSIFHARFWYYINFVQPYEVGGAYDMLCKDLNKYIKT